MFTNIVLGIVVSLASEAITYINKKLTSTLLAGKAAFIVAGGVAFIGGAFKVLLLPQIPANYIQAVTSNATQIFAVSQVWFVLIYQALGLDVGPENANPSLPGATRIE